MNRLIKRANARAIYFSECEHSGDLNDYISDVQRCLGSQDKIVDSGYDSNEESGYVKVAFENDESLKAFIQKFKQTPSCDFSNVR